MYKNQNLNPTRLNIKREEKLYIITSKVRERHQDAKVCLTDRERERKRQTDRQTDRDGQRDSETDRDRDTNRDTDRNRETDRADGHETGRTC